MHTREGNASVNCPAKLHFHLPTGWPTCVGTGGRHGSEYAMKVVRRSRTRTGSGLSASSRPQGLSAAIWSRGTRFRLLLCPCRHCRAATACIVYRQLAGTAQIGRPRLFHGGVQSAAGLRLSALQTGRTKACRMIHQPGPRNRAPSFLVQAEPANQRVEEGGACHQMKFWQNSSQPNISTSLNAKQAMQEAGEISDSFPVIANDGSP